MRMLMVECYTLLFKITRAKGFSYWVGLLYLTALVYWVVNGLSELTTGWLPMASIINKLFNFPFCIGMAAVIFGVIYKFAPDIKELSKDRKKNNGYTTILLFSLSVILLIIYMKFGDSFFT